MTTLSLCSAIYLHKECHVRFWPDKPSSLTHQCYATYTEVYLQLFVLLAQQICCFQFLQILPCLFLPDLLILTIQWSLSITWDQRKESKVLDFPQGRAFKKYFFVISRHGTESLYLRKWRKSATASLYLRKLGKLKPPVWPWKAGESESASLYLRKSGKLKLAVCTWGSKGKWNWQFVPEGAGESEAACLYLRKSGKVKLPVCTWGNSGKWNSQFVPEEIAESETASLYLRK